MRLKKKAKAPAPEITPEKKPTDKPEPRKDDKDEPAPEKADQDAKETLERINRNMRTSEDRLARKDPGEGTRSIQRDILKDLDALIEQTQRQQQQQAGGGGSSRSLERRPQSGTPQKQSASGKKSGADKKPKSGAEGREGDSANRGPSKIADLYKEIWGHLPETLRQEMDTYAREQFMAKYNDLLKQYYATIAEKGRRQE